MAIEPAKVATEEIVECDAEPADEFDEFLCEWGRESAKRSLPLVNEVLRLLLALDVTLLGGGIVFVDSKVIDAGFRIIVFGFFLASLGMAFWGVYPYEGDPVDLSDPSLIREHKIKALHSKKNKLLWACFFLWCGFLLAIGGIIWRWLYPVAPLP